MSGGGGYLAYRSYAIYQEEKTFNVIKGVIPEFGSDIYLGYTINGTENYGTYPSFPQKETGLIGTSVECEKNVLAEWDNEKWSLSNIRANTNKRVKCTVNFEEGSLAKINIKGNGSVDKTNINVLKSSGNSFTVTPSSGYYLNDISCTNGYVLGSYTNGESATGSQTITINNNNKNTNSACTINFFRPANYGEKPASYYPFLYYKNGNNMIEISKSVIDSYSGGNYDRVYGLHANLGEKVRNRVVLYNTGTAVAGDKTYNFETNLELNRWIDINFHINNSGGVTMNNLKIIYEDDSIYTLEESITNGYIEPLLIIGSSAQNGGWVCTDFYNQMLIGGSTYCGYSYNHVYFKVKDVSPIVGFTLYVSKNLGSSNSVSFLQYPDTFDISTRPFQ